MLHADVTYGYEPAETYFACPRISHSKLEVFRGSVADYHGRYVVQTIPDTPPTDSMILGTAVHTLLFEPDRIKERVAILADVDLRTKAGKEALEAVRVAVPGVPVIRQKAYDLASAMVGAIRASDVAMSKLDNKDAKHEMSVRWTDGNKLRLRSRLDMVAPGIVCDIKTCDDPSPYAFSRNCVNYGYFRQADFYQDAAFALFDVPAEFFFVAVGSSPPHEVAVYRPHAGDLRIARRQNQALKRRLMDCLDFDNWLSPWTAEIQTLKLPSWAPQE